MIFSIAIWLVIIASLIYLLIRKIIKEENEDFENRDKIIEIIRVFSNKENYNIKKQEYLEKELRIVNLRLNPRNHNELKKEFVQ